MPSPSQPGTNARGPGSRFSQRLIDQLQSVDAYPYRFDSPVVLHETHVSWVFLAGDYAYKIKKPISTGFLDYSTLPQREHFCHEEIRLDRRYTDDLYLDVVPITIQEGQVKVEGAGDPVEYAVKMRRFPEEALLSYQLDLGLLTPREIKQLADAVASFHQRAKRCTETNRYATAPLIEKDFQDCLDDLASGVVKDQSVTARQRLEGWAERFLRQYRPAFAQRLANGFVRECHGDLHLDNVIHLGQRLVPFDGIEFNDAFRWIDVLNDAAFLIMDFVAHGHVDFGAWFLSSYLERTGDYESIVLMRWYLVYRALVRAKVAAIRAAQEPNKNTEPLQDCMDHIALAEKFANPPPARLWITHGLSGSGKTTASQVYVLQQNAIRLRSDLERKRMFGITANEQAPRKMRHEVYSAAATDKVYERLRELATKLLQAGFSVVVDATFLQREQRDSFRKLALRMQVEWGIIDCQAEPDVLRQRVKDRLESGGDASDADVEVLERQLAEQQPLTQDEQEAVER